jgi:Protein of unknown function (DUF2950)
MEKTIMPVANMSSEMLKSGLLGLVSGIGLSALAIIFAPSTFAQEPGQENFASAEQATNALFVAAQHNDEQAIIKILGGGKDSVSSGDEIEDKHELEQFAQKYQEMHRLGRNPDGNTVLYVGAENVCEGQPRSGGIAQAHAEDVFAPFYGYVFNKLPDQQHGSVFLAYPSQYRSSGVMTFVAAQDDTVYQKDLGPDTARVAEALVAWKPDSSWHVAG